MPDKIKKNTKTWIGVERVGAYMIFLLTIYMKTQCGLLKCSAFLPNLHSSLLETRREIKMAADISNTKFHFHFRIFRIQIALETIHYVYSCLEMYHIQVSWLNTVEFLQLIVNSFSKLTFTFIMHFLRFTCLG